MRREATNRGNKEHPIVLPLMKSIRLRLDPWPAEYESPFQIDEFQEEADATVDTAVEGGDGRQWNKPGGNDLR